MARRYAPLTEDEKRTIVELYEAGWPISRIAKHLGRHDAGIGRFLRRQGYTTPGRGGNAPRIHWTQDEIDNIKRLYVEEGFTLEEIAKLYSHRTSCPETIANLLKRHGVTIRSRGMQPKLERHDYFSVIDSEAKAYFLGLLLADGCVQAGRHSDLPSMVSISLVYHDAYLLERFRQEVGSTNKITLNKRAGRKPMVKLSLTSRTMVADLIRYGIVPNKTNAQLSLPKLSPSLMPHFIRGFFDGDGTVYTGYRKNWKYLNFGFYGCYQLLSELRDFLVDEIGLSRRKVIDKGSVCFVYFGNKHDVPAFYHYIYDNATIYMERKRRVFDEYLANTEVTVAAA